MRCCCSVELETRLESAERRASMLAGCVDSDVSDPCRCNGSDPRRPTTNHTRRDDDDDDVSDDDVNDDSDVTPPAADHSSTQPSVNA